MAKDNKLEMAIELPDKVEAKIEGNNLVIKGPKGEAVRDIRNPQISFKIQDGKVMITSDRLTKREKKVGFTYQAHVKNMIRGASEGHVYALKICSSHFPMNVSVSNNQIIIKNFLGEKSPRILNIKEGASVKVDGDKIEVTGSNKEIVGTVASDIEKLTRRPNFDMRIFQDGIYITQKDGKDIK